MIEENVSQKVWLRCTLHCTHEHTALKHKNIPDKNVPNFLNFSGQPVSNNVRGGQKGKSSPFEACEDSTFYDEILVVDSI